MSCPRDVGDASFRFLDFLGLYIWVAAPPLFESTFAFVDWKFLAFLFLDAFDFFLRCTIPFYPPPFLTPRV